MFYDLKVVPDDRETLADMIKVAKEMGYLGLGFVGDFQEIEGTFRIREYEMRSKRDLREIPYGEVNFVYSENRNVLRYSVKLERVDGIIFREIDEVLVREASKNKTALVIDLSSLRNGKLGGIKKVRKLFLVCYSKRAPVICVSSARLPEEMFSPRDLLALLELLGVPREYAKASLTTYPRFVLKKKGRI
ncbi:MAG TPA: hypothetical protein ENF65_02965 [Euryarchaeota archaeon]|nr:MAG: hypothetical protein DRN46_04610 [Thermococci archaeon]RLF97107.1 MAG: hypothetical protein DRN52_01195 [Thermococci archaeon]HDI10691.1 hypothetical protein [Euryarchaeota archaeon]